MTSIKTQNSAFILIALIVFSHLIHQPVVTNICMSLLGLTALFSKDLKQRFINNIQQPAFWICMGIFLIYAIGLLYSTNTKEGIRSVSAKLPLFVFPLIFAMLPISKKLFTSVLKSFLILLLITLIGSFFIQLVAYKTTGDLSLLYNDNLGSPFGIQAVYNGLFINMALIIVFWVIDQKEISKTEKIVFALSGLLLLSFQFLLISRIALLLSIAIVLFSTLNLILAKRSLKIVLPTLLLILALPVIAFLSSEKLQNRFASIFQTEFQFDNPNPINHFNAEQSENNWNSSTARLATWTCAFEVFKASPIIGYGVGDHFDELMKEYERKNYILGLKEQYNTHNQYLDISLAAGIIGLIILIIFFLYPIYISIKTKNTFLFSMMTLLALSASTENILNRSQGIIIIAVITSFILTYLIIAKKHPTEK